MSLYTPTSQSPTSPIQLNTQTDLLPSSTTQSTEYPRTYSIDGSEPLKPIREEKSQESLDVNSKKVNVITEQIGEEETESHATFHRNHNSDLVTRTSISEDRNSTVSPLNPSDVSMEDSRYRSVSLTEDSARVQETRSPRSSSFSGTMQNRFLTRTSMHPRSGSDPGLGINASSLTGSLSSQESDNSSRYDNLTNKKSSYKKPGNRKKSRSETSDITEHRRYSSILSDSGTASRMNKRSRGGSTLSLGVSPNRARSFIAPSDSPLSREGGYSAWQTLKKQRPFKKELDWNLRRHLAASDKRRFGR